MVRTDWAFADGKVWFTAEGSKSVGRYDPAIAMMDWSMGTGQNRTHMIYVTPDGKNVYTTNVSSGTVSILKDTLIQPGPPPGPPPGGQQGTPPEVHHFPARNRIGIGFKRLFPCQGVRKDLTYHQTVVNYGLQLLMMEVSPSSILLQKN